MPRFIDTELNDWKNSRNLVPDGKYITTQTKSAHDVCAAIEGGIHESIKNKTKRSLPHLIIAFGKCRVGSTALTNAVGRSGIASYFQPFKSILRQRLCDDWNLSHLEQMWENKTVFCKEMFGPYTEFESRWNPFQSLIDLGYPAEKLTLIWLERDPIDSLISWQRNWASVVQRPSLLRHFQIASQTACNVAGAFESYGAKVVRFNYESLKSNPNAIYQLLSAIDVTPQDPSRVVAWGRSAGDLASKASSIIFTNEPSVYGAVKVHSNRSEYGYVTQTKERLGDDAMDAIHVAGLHQIFEDHRLNCITRSSGPILANAVAGV